MKNEEDFFVKRPDGSLVSPIVIVNEKYNTIAQYEETIKNKKDCIFQTVLKINGVIKATGLGYNAKISKIQAAFQYYVTNENKLSGDLEKSMNLVQLRSHVEHQTDNNSGKQSFDQVNQVNIDQFDMPKYRKESYQINGKKVCLVLVISKFDKSEHDREYTENDYKQAYEVLKRRGFEVISLVGRVTKNNFKEKLKEIKKRTDIGLFMLVVSSHGDENDNVMFSDNSNWNNGKPRYVLHVMKFAENCRI